MSGLQLSDMTDSLTVFPDGAFVPLVVEANVAGLVTTVNYRYNAGLYLAKYSTLAAATGAALIGSTGPSTVQADINARPTSAVLAASGGAALVGFTDGGTGADATTVQAALRETVALPRYRAAAATDDSTAWQEVLAASAAGRAIHLPGGQGTGAAGKYLITTAASGSGYLTANTLVYGDGIGKTVVRPVAAGQTSFRALSASAGTTVDNIVFMDMTFQGYSASGFSEQVHLFAINGVRNVYFIRCQFLSPQGDAIYLGTGETPGTGRHNYNVHIVDCQFDGVNNENRAALSVIDCDGLWVVRSPVANFTKSTMPGAINFEPDAADTTAVLKNINITGNAFAACGGNIGTIALPVPAAVAVPRAVRIAGNTFTGSVGTGAEITANTSRTPGATDLDSDIVIDANSGFGGIKPISLAGIKGVTVTATNFWYDYDTTVLLGFNGSTDTIRNVSYDGTHVLVGTNSGESGVLVGKVAGVSGKSGLTLQGTYDRCGFADAAVAAIKFLTGVTTDSVAIKNLTVIGNTSQTAAILVSGTLTPTTNRLGPNVNIGALTSAFTAINQAGTAVLVSGTVTVTAPGVSATSLITAQRNIDGGTPGCSYSITRSNGASLTVTSKRSDGTTTETSDTSTIAYTMNPPL